jgi:hypothetical protein
MPFFDMIAAALISNSILRVQASNSTARPPASCCTEVGARGVPCSFVRTMPLRERKWVPISCAARDILLRNDMLHTETHNCDERVCPWGEVLLRGISQGGSMLRG